MGNREVNFLEYEYALENARIKKTRILACFMQ